MTRIGPQPKQIRQGGRQLFKPPKLPEGQARRVVLYEHWRMTRNARVTANYYGVAEEDVRRAVRTAGRTDEEMGI